MNTNMQRAGHEASAFQGFKRILVATDFSPHARAALTQAVWLGRKSRASITLAHALPDLRKVVHAASYRAKLDLLYGEGQDFECEVRRESDARLKRLADGLNAPEIQIRVETLLGEPYVELTHAVLQEGHDLVLAGTSGATDWQQLLVGSTARRLIRKCPCTVWIAKDERIEPPNIVLAATDFSVPSTRAVEQAVWIAALASADLHLLHVVDSSDLPRDLAERVPSEGSSLRAMICDEARARLDQELAAIKQRTAVRIHPHLTWGTPWKEIGRLAQHLHANLVAMGTVGRSGVKGLFLGNTAEKVLDQCEASILSVKPADYVSPIAPASWALHP